MNNSTIISEINQIITKTNAIINEYEKIDKITGNNFNIFQILGLTNYEVKLHSKFIAELLNPKGSHGQNDTFLKLFIETLDIDNFDNKNCIVKTEKYIGKKEKETGGRLDIFIKNQNNGKTIIIENKIYADDQENQLIRYNNYNPSYLFYLTLYGTEPSEKSIGNLIKGKDFHTLSYENEILDWLIKCRKEASIYPLLREAISHYINLIKLLTGKSLNDNMKTEIIDEILKSKNTLKSSIELEKNIVDAKILTQWNFWKALIDEIEKQNLELNNRKVVTKKNVENFYRKSRYRDIYYGLSISAFKNDNIEIDYTIEINHEVYYGFKIYKNNKGDIALNDEFKNYRKFVKEIDNGYVARKHWLGEKNIEKKLDFRKFNSENIFELVDEKLLDKTVQDIVNKAKDDINKLREKINNS